MRFLDAFMYLVAIGVGLWLGAYAPSALVRATRKHASFHVAGIGIRFASLLLTFGSFWALTRLFPFRFILALFAAILIWEVIGSIAGATAGFGLPQVRQKINVLGMIWGIAMPKARGCLFIVLGGLGIAIAVAGSLYAFWVYPLGSPEAKVVIAFYTFIVPGLFALCPLLIATVPVVTSPYLDDDYRNSHLVTHFSTLLSVMVFLLFPALLLKGETRLYFAQRYWHWPPLWVLVAVPLAGYVFGAIIPFFIGFYRHRAQRKLLAEWRRRWIADFLKALILPDEMRHAEINRLEDQLRRQMYEFAEQNDLLRFYRRLLEFENRDADLPSEANMPPLPSGERGTSSLPDGAELDLDLQNFPRRLKEQIRQMRTIIRENVGQLPSWDIRFRHLAQLQRLRKLAAMAENSPVEESMRAEQTQATEELKTSSGQKNVLASAYLTAVSSVTIYLFHHFEQQLLPLAQWLVRSH